MSRAGQVFLSRRMLVAALLVLLAHGATVAEPGASSGTWTWDLAERGCAGDDHEVFKGGGVPDARVAFGSNGEIVVLCHSRIERGGNWYDVAKRALAIETVSGRVCGTLEWTGYGSSAVFSTADGNYAIRRKGTGLYGPGLRNELAHSPNGIEMISPRGGRFVARTRPEKGKQEVWVTMDAATLAETGPLPSFNRGSVSDISVASLVLGLPNSPFIEIVTKDKQPVEVATGSPAGSPEFVSEEALVAVFPDRFELMSIAGQRLLSGPHGYEDGLRVAAARDGRRMAVTHDRFSGHWSVIKDEVVTVYDLTSMKSIWTFKHTGMKGAFSGHSDVALSPDGSLLAIKWPGHVRLFELPAVHPDGGSR